MEQRRGKGPRGCPQARVFCFVVPVCFVDIFIGLPGVRYLTGLSGILDLCPV